MRAIQSNPPLKFLPIRRDFRFDEKKSLFLTFLLKAQRLNRDILKNSITDFYSLKLQFRAESKKARKKSRFSKKKNCCSSFKSISPVRRFTFSPGSFRVRGGKIDLGTGINDPNRWRKLHFFFSNVSWENSARTGQATGWSFTIRSYRIARIDLERGEGIEGGASIAYYQTIAHYLVARISRVYRVSTWNEKYLIEISKEKIG